MAPGLQAERRPVRKPHVSRGGRKTAAAGFAFSLLAHGLTAGAVALAPKLVNKPAQADAAVRIELADPQELDLHGLNVAEQTAASPSPATPATTRPRHLAFRPRARSLAPYVAPETIAPQRAIGSSPAIAPSARFVMSAGTVSNRGSQAQSATNAAVGVGSSAANIVGEGAVDTGARLLAGRPIAYPTAARRAEIEMDVPLELVLDTEGRVQEARVVNRTGYGFDEAALHAIYGYRFSPALRGGQPVGVRMRWTVQFRLD